MQDKTVTDNKLVKAFRNTPDRAWPTAGKEVARHNADPFKCSFCQNRGIKSFPTMYGLGTTTAKHTKACLFKPGGRARFANPKLPNSVRLLVNVSIGWQACCSS